VSVLFIAFVRRVHRGRRALTGPARHAAQTPTLRWFFEQQRTALTPRPARRIWPSDSLTSTLNAYSVALLVSKRLTKNILVLRFEISCETQDLKAVAIADGPEVKFVADLHEAGCASCPVGGSISTRCPRE